MGLVCGILGAVVMSIDIKEVIYKLSDSKNEFEETNPEPVDEETKVFEF